MYSLFCESLNKVQMKLMKLQSYTDFAISLFDFRWNDFHDFVRNLSTVIQSSSIVVLHIYAKKDKFL